MVRIYTADQGLRELILKQWKAYVSIGKGPRVPLSIARGDIRGLVASGQLDLSQLSLKAGSNSVLVEFETNLDNGQKHSIGLHGQLSLTP